MMYLAANYSNLPSNEVEVEQHKIELKFNNRIELVFDLEGNFDYILI
jgi:hypothetical protein